MGGGLGAGVNGGSGGAHHRIGPSTRPHDHAGADKKTGKFDTYFERTFCTKQRNLTLAFLHSSQNNLPGSPIGGWVATRHGGNDGGLSRDRF